MTLRRRLFSPAVRRYLELTLAPTKRRWMTHRIYIALTYDCCRQCHYCCAAHLRGHFGGAMTVADYERVLDWAVPQGLHVTFVGGEPTLHPRFADILAISRERGVPCNLATNGMVDTAMLDLIAAHPFLRRVIVNYNPRRDYTEAEYDTYTAALTGLRERRVPFALCHNIGADCRQKDADELVDVAAMHDASILICLTIPHGVDLERETESLLRIADRACLQGVPCTVYRPVPRCLVSDAQWRRLRTVLGKFRDFAVCYMGPQIVNPDLSVLPCMGLSDLSMTGPKLLSFPNLNAIHRYYAREIDTVARTPPDPRCEKCRYWTHGRCQGGCLANRPSGSWSATSAQDSA